MRTETKPLFFFLSLATWGTLAVGGAFLVALGEVIFGVLLVIAAIPAAALVEIAGEVQVGAEQEPEPGRREEERVAGRYGLYPGA